jgi:molecular chaperone GrpE
MPSSPASDAVESQAPEGEDQAALLAEAEDRYKRALADLDNYRKRSAKEVERRVDESRAALLRDWLDPLDSVERALQSVAGENPFAEGLRAILEQMEATMSRQGAERVGAAGERFDPERHEAVGVRQSNEVDDLTVLDVARSGWAIGDRVLRPAQVVVSRRGGSES